MFLLLSNATSKIHVNSQGKKWRSEYLLSPSSPLLPRLILLELPSLPLEYCESWLMCGAHDVSFCKHQLREVFFCSHGVFWWIHTDMVDKWSFSIFSWKSSQRSFPSLYLNLKHFFIDYNSFHCDSTKYLKLVTFDQSPKFLWRAEGWGDAGFDLVRRNRGKHLLFSSSEKVSESFSSFIHAGAASQAVP